MNFQTTRFGNLSLRTEEIILFPEGIHGFPSLKRFCIVDPSDDTLILWLQSLDEPAIAFPVLEPKIFKPEYLVRLSAAELRELKLADLKQISVFSILTIPGDIAEMSANLKAPVVINLKDRLAKQVVLQENEYSIKHLMFKELKVHLMTITSQKLNGVRDVGPIQIDSLPASNAIKALQADI